MDRPGDPNNQRETGATSSQSAVKTQADNDIELKYQIKQLKEAFVLVAKRILKDQLSTNKKTLLAYKSDIIESYTEVIKFISEQYDASTTTESQKKSLLESANYFYEKFEACLIRLNCQYTLPASVFVPIDPETIKLINIEVEQEIITVEEQNLNSEIPNMTEITKTELMKVASNYLNKPYNGDPLGLASFIDSCKLLQTLPTSNEMHVFLATLIRTKIDGRARDFLTNNVNTIDEIIATLEANIKHDNSKILEGRMLALKLTNTNQEDFATKTEKLADSLRRTLIIEGMTAVKATEISIEKTLELCRNNAHNDLVKSVLEASAYNSPKEVVAKLIVQREKSKKDAQILTFRHQQPNRGAQAQRQNFKPNERRNFNSNTNFGNPTNNFNRRNSNNNQSNNNNRRFEQNPNRREHRSHSRTYTNSNYYPQNRNPVNNIRVVSSEQGNGESGSHQAVGAVPSSHNQQHHTDVLY